MTRNCGCGGRLRRSDLYRDPTTGLVGDSDPLSANWRCEKCGATRRQRKRLPVERAVGAHRPLTLAERQACRRVGAALTALGVGATYLEADLVMGLDGSGHGTPSRQLAMDALRRLPRKVADECEREAAPLLG